MAVVTLPPQLANSPRRLPQNRQPAGTPLPGSQARIANRHGVMKMNRFEMTQGCSVMVRKMLILDSDLDMAEGRTWST